MSHSQQHKSSSSRSSIEKVFGYRRRDMTSRHNNKSSTSQLQEHYTPAPTPVEHKRSSSYTGSGSGPVSSSSSRSSMNLEPAPHVAEWCHQMHMMQNRKYEWCNGCHPRVFVTPPNMPSEKVMQQIRRTGNEPSHAYQ